MHPRNRKNKQININDHGAYVKEALQLCRYQSVTLITKPKSLSPALLFIHYLSDRITTHQANIILRIGTTTQQNNKQRKQQKRNNSIMNKGSISWEWEGKTKDGRDEALGKEGLGAVLEGEESEVEPHPRARRAATGRQHRRRQDLR